MREGIDCNGKKWTEYTKPYPKRYDITGQVFGDLTALFRVDVNSYRECALWLCKCLYRCRCECGAEKSVRRQLLLDGHVVSCGCYSRDEKSQRQLIDITGQRFGLLTVFSIKAEMAFTGMFAAIVGRKKLFLDTQ